MILCLFLGILTAVSAYSQPVRFQIGAYGVTATPSLTNGNPRWDTLRNPGDDRHRIETPGDEMDSTAWALLRNLHLTMPLQSALESDVYQVDRGTPFPRLPLIRKLHVIALHFRSAAPAA
jgi:hypothetical protein